MTNDTQGGIEEFICRNKLEGIFDYFWSAENKPSKPNPKGSKTLSINDKIFSSKLNENKFEILPLNKKIDKKKRR